jgi:hypothetical protein
MRYIIFNFMALPYFVCAANAQLFDCKLLESAISNPNFKKEFVICKGEDFVQIFDEKRAFGDCSIMKICNKKIVITNDTLYDNITPDKHSIHKKPNLIILHNIEKTRRKYTLFFWRPYSGAGLKLSFIKRWGRWKLIESEVGTF